MFKRGLLAVSSLLIVIASAFSETNAMKPVPRETVILIHGLMNRPAMMKPLEWALEREGYRVINWGYPSRELGVEQIAERLHQAAQKIDPGDTVHFVGFSLGALSARYYLSHYLVPNAGRLVQIAPPNHGSGRADQLYDYKWFRAIWGEHATLQMRTTNQEFFGRCGIPRCPFGIIAGGKGDTEGYSRSIPGDDDVTVAVESARLEGAADFVLLRRPHTLLLFSDDTIDNVISFLKVGRFVAEHHEVRVMSAKIKKRGDRHEQD